MASDAPIHLELIANSTGHRQAWADPVFEVEADDAIIRPFPLRALVSLALLAALALGAVAMLLTDVQPTVKAATPVAMVTAERSVTDRGPAPLAPALHPGAIDIAAPATEKPASVGRLVPQRRAAPPRAIAAPLSIDPMEERR